MNRYIEHIINDLVRDTRIDYDEEEIHFPFPLPHPHIHPYLPFPFFPNLLSFSNRNPTLSFSKYCKDTYGLTEEEIEYVWDQYKSTIKDKITNR